MITIDELQKLRTRSGPLMLIEVIEMEKHECSDPIKGPMRLNIRDYS